MNANDLRPGMVIKHNNELYSIFKAEHRTPGNLRAFVQARMRNLRSGAMIDHRFRSEDEVERAIIDEAPMQYLYSDGDSYYFIIPRPTSNCTCRRKWWATARNTLCRTSPCRLPFMNRAPLTSFCPPPWTLKWLRPNRALKVDRPRTLESLPSSKPA